MLRAFFWYLLFGVPLGIAVPAWFLASGKAPEPCSRPPLSQVCGSVVEDELQRLGPAFVCGFTESFVFMWTCVSGLVHCYVVYVVWSAAEKISEIPNNSVPLGFVACWWFRPGLSQVLDDLCQQAAVYGQNGLDGDGCQVCAPPKTKK